MKNNNIVSIIIPTKNSERFLENCLRSIKNQSYKKIEVLIIDGGSSDSTIEISKKYKTKILNYIPNVLRGKFDAPYKRNYGARMAKGKYLYYVDADMELSKNVVKEAVELCHKNGVSAIIIREDSFGKGIWAKAKNLEKRCYWGDDTQEAPRFFLSSVWKKLGGLDEGLGGGGDDWDLYQKLLEEGYSVGRIKSIVKHNEGDLRLKHLIKKRFMYGRDSLKYIKKRPTAAFKSYSPLRIGYFKNWKLIINRPVDAAALIIMRVAEYSSGFAGILYSLIKNEKFLEE